MFTLESSITSYDLERYIWWWFKYNVEAYEG